MIKLNDVLDNYGKIEQDFNANIEKMIADPSKIKDEYLDYFIEKSSCDYSEEFNVDYLLEAEKIIISQLIYIPIKKADTNIYEYHCDNFLSVSFYKDYLDFGKKDKGLDLKVIFEINSHKYDQYILERMKYFSYNHNNESAIKFVKDINNAMKNYYDLSKQNKFESYLNKKYKDTLFMNQIKFAIENLNEFFNPKNSTVKKIKIINIINNLIDVLEKININHSLDDVLIIKNKHIQYDEFSLNPIDINTIMKFTKIKKMFELMVDYLGLLSIDECNKISKLAENMYRYLYAFSSDAIKMDEMHDYLFSELNAVSIYNNLRILNNLKNNKNFKGKESLITNAKNFIKNKYNYKQPRIIKITNNKITFKSYYIDYGIDSFNRYDGKKNYTVIVDNILSDKVEHFEYKV